MSESKENYFKFLQTVNASVESLIRSYDTKAQIASAVFTISLVPLYFYGKFIDPVRFLLFFGCAITIILYVWTLMPINRGKYSVFYRYSAQDTAKELHRKIKESNLEVLLCQNILNLHEIRKEKVIRLRIALAASIIFYLFTIFSCVVSYYINNKSILHFAYSTFTYLV